MCGIFGYVGTGVSVGQLIDGLSRLEYRGYDSCGIAGFANGKLFIKKRSGKIAQLRSDLDASLKKKVPIAVLHTRWATHGRPNTINAHPHTGSKRIVALVHNGIIENYLAVKDQLVARGVTFKSQTDTEVVAHLIESLYTKTLEDAVQRAAKKLEGSFAICAVSKKEPGKLVVARKGSPLIIGIGNAGIFVASDIPALVPFVKKVLYVQDEEIAVIHKEKISLMTFAGRMVRPRFESVSIKVEDTGKAGFGHFMLKEIHEQPTVLARTLSLYVRKNKIEFPLMKIKSAVLRRAKKIYITACGTAYHAGYVAKYFLERFCNVTVEIDTSSEFRYRALTLRKGDLLIAISQSGETADTLAAAREAKRKGAVLLSVCNVLGSTLVRESDGLIFTPAGPEIGVASTKAYTAQVFALYLFALYFGGLTGALPSRLRQSLLRELRTIPRVLQEVINDSDKMRRIAHKFSRFGCFLFLGRGINYPSAMEGALKLKEISYIPAEGYPAGEMKHGPIALIDEYRGVVCIAPHDELYEKMVSNMQEIKARKGKIVGVVNDGDKHARLLCDERIIIPRLKNQALSPLPVAVCLQLFAYFLAKNLGCEIDQPRNLAKSVTVE